MDTIYIVLEYDFEGERIVKAFYSQEKAKELANASDFYRVKSIYIE